MAFPRTVLGIKAELLLNGTWTDITQFVYQRDDIHIASRGRPNEAQAITPSDCTFTLNNQNGNFSAKNTGGLFYPYIGRNVQFRLSVSDQSLNSTAYSGYRFWGEISAWPVKWDSTGSDVYVQVTASGVLQRYVQGGNIGSALKRFYLLKTDATAPVALWSMEELGGAGQFVNSVSDGNDMTWTGTPTLASDTSFEGTDPLPLISLGVLTGSTGSFSAGSGSAVYSTPGTYSWLALVSSVDAKCIGGGGGGGFGAAPSGAGGSGGGAESAEEATAATTVGNMYTVVVGAGGVGGSSSAPTAGGSSTFTGDAVTVTAHGGGAAGNGVTGTGGTAGAAGTGSTNTTHHNGGAGLAGSSSTNTGGPGGGSSGGTSAAGNAGSAQSAGTGGAGGAAVTGGGAGGSGGTWSASCVDAETEILTRRGWLRYSDVRDDDETLTLRPGDWQQEWAAIERVRAHEGAALMTLLESPEISACANAEHRWLVRTYEGEWLYRYTPELRDSDRILLCSGEFVLVGDCTRTGIEVAGPVWCPTTPNGNWAARRNGFSYFIGNKP